MPRRDRGFRAGGTDGRARWGRAVSEGLILHAVPYGSLIIAVFYTAKAKKTQKNLRMCNFCCNFAPDFERIAPSGGTEDGFDCLQPHEKMLKLVPQDQTVACGFIFAKYQNGTW